MRFFVFVALHGVTALVLAGCAQDDVEKARARMREGQEVQTESRPDAIPIAPEGIGSLAELQRDLDKLQDAASSQDFDRAFRLTFSSDRSQRDYATARSLLLQLLVSEPGFAPAYRTLGYAEFNLDPMNTTGSLARYSKAVELDPAYGEAHYAIAFMHAATGDLDRGFEHYRKAMALGIADERNIGERFYGKYLKGS